MAKRMLIDATHAEETRVVVLDGNRLEDFDIETSTKRQLKGNIYLAKVVRVEPSLQAAFVEYGGNRHGFLAFSEIHPDYYQIPVADRQRLLEMQAEEARREEEEEDLELALSQAATAAPVARIAAAPAPVPAAAIPAGPSESWAHADVPPLTAPPLPVENWAHPDLPRLEAAADSPLAPPPATEVPAEIWALAAVPALVAPDTTVAEEPRADETTNDADDSQPETGDDLDIYGSIPEEAPPETLGGADNPDDGGDERQERRIPPRFLRNYHIQEVIHRRQILLVQVVKEERGTKGAALTTYLSLAGRFSVLMPNSPRGGGISRKITSAADRRRLKELMIELDIPKGMGLIVRTAGAQRPKPEIRRDCEYLLRLWDDIRDHTLKSIAPALVYEEASLIKRAIRDVYSREIDDITVDGEDGWRAAHEFMRMLMPSHARKVIHWPDQGQSLFARFQVEAQLDAMMQPTVQLRSGGYLVINQAEALVAIDVNSGRSTRERNVEETAVRTNLEAADEVARQLRLRDLAGLIVIDFIDMESKRHNAMVERRMKEALKDDRARIQLGHISHFGLMEMSRQRLRPSLEETTLIICPHCNGTGHVRGTESAALHVLRGVEEEAGKRRSAEVIVHVATPIALYILNHKRERLNEIERRYGMRVIVAADDSLIAPRFRIDRVRAMMPGEEPRFVTPDAPRPSLVAPPVETYDSEDEDEEAEDAEDAIAAAANGTAEETEESREAERRRKRRRRRRRGGRDDDERPGVGSAAGRGDLGGDPGDDAEPPAREHAAEAALTIAEPDRIAAEPVADAGAAEDDAARRRGRGRGRSRRRRDEDGGLSPLGVPGAEQPDLVPVYAGPTPADPFGGGAFDIFDAMEQAELAAAAPRRAPSRSRGGYGGGQSGGRSRWQPLSWAVASQPPMLVAETSTERPDRDLRPEAWAMPQRPFMLRRDRHAPRWSQPRGATPASAAPPAAALPGAVAEPAAAMPVVTPSRGNVVTPSRGNVVTPSRGSEVWAAADEPRMLAPAPAVVVLPIEAGPPPVVEPVAAVANPAAETRQDAPAMEPVATSSVDPLPSQAAATSPAGLAGESALAEAAAGPMETGGEISPAAAPEPEARPVASEPAEAGIQSEIAEHANTMVEPAVSPLAEPVAQAAPARTAADQGAEVVELVRPDAAAEPVSGPVVKPVLVDSAAAPPAQKKRGWWRRG